jgi:hypothetical protein
MRKAERSATKGPKAAGALAESRLRGSALDLGMTLRGPVTTTQKFKSIGEETYCWSQDDQTEIVRVQQIVVEDKDANFEKIWIYNAAEALNALSGKKARVLWYLFRKKDRQNQVLKSGMEISEALHLSYGTVASALSILQKYDVICRRTRLITVNPDVIFRGKRDARLRARKEFGEVKAEKRNRGASTLQTVRMIGQLISELRKSENESVRMAAMKLPIQDLLKIARQQTR